MTIVYGDRWRRWGTEVDGNEFWKFCRPEAPYELHVFENERVAVLNIPHGELAHKFSYDEWDNLLAFIHGNFGSREMLVRQYRKSVSHERLTVIVLFVGFVLIVALFMLYTMYA